MNYIDYILEQLLAALHNEEPIATAPKRASIGEYYYFLSPHSDTHCDQYPPIKGLDYEQKYRSQTETEYIR